MTLAQTMDAVPTVTALQIRNLTLASAEPDGAVHLRVGWEKNNRVGMV